MATPVEVDERRLGRDLDLPLSVDGDLDVTATGDVRSVAGRSNMRQAVRRRVLTAPGSLIHRPKYGAGLADFLEVTTTPAMRSSLSNAIRRNLLRDGRLAKARAKVSVGLPDVPSREGAVTVELAIDLRHDQSRQDLSLNVAE